MSRFHIRNIAAEDRDEVAKLIFHSTNGYYESIGREPIFKGDELSTRLFVDVYERLDGQAALVAADDASRAIIGCCFVHAREMHVSLGIMNVHPDHFGRGIAGALLQRIIAFAVEQGKPVRLVSSCWNLDSYSLYTRAGFAPFCTYQDMVLTVPEGGLTEAAPDHIAVRQATPDDVPAMATLEKDVSGISRTTDYRYFIENSDGLWHVSVVESREAGNLDGFLASCNSPVANMIGPGVSRTEAQAAALLHTELNVHRGRTPVFLVPVHCKQLVQQLYRWGARNCEMHVGQSNGEAVTPRGVTMPTFLPETG